MLGGLTLVSLLLLIGTGIILDQYYSPTQLDAHNSVVYIMTRVPLGNWVRAIHHWAATTAFVSVALHLGLVFWRRSYRSPRAATWLTGVALLLVVFGLIFSGSVLPTDQEAVEAMAHAVAGAKMSGPLGAVLTPDFTPSTSLLSRMHSVHVSLLPLALLAIVSAHFLLIRAIGIHAEGAPTATFSQHLRKLSGAGLLLAAGIGALAALAPHGLGHPGVEGVEVTKPAWMFLWIYAVENTMGMVGMLVAPVVLFGFIAVVPWLDRNPAPGAPRPRWLVALALVLLAAWVGGIIYGFVAPQQQHLGM